MLARMLTLLLVAAAGSMAGCGSTDGVALFPVEGEVRYNGQPVAGAQVVFHPCQARAGVPPARAQTDASGKFQLTTFNAHDGAPAGDYAVTVEFFPLQRWQDEFLAGRNALPPKYATSATTDLRIQVASGPNKLNALEIKR